MNLFNILYETIITSDNPRTPTEYWHGTASQDLRGGTSGLHVGSKLAAKQALEARIGIRADGKDWDGTQEYGKTLLAGRKTLKKLDPKGFNITGYNVDAPDEDYYPTEQNFRRAKYSNMEEIPFTVKPNMFKVRITGKMTNTPYRPHSDQKANSMMKGLIKRGGSKSGFYYKNDAEDSGSVSAVVPNVSHIVRESLFESTYNHILLEANVKTPAFKRWFGDSKVVDRNGKPLVVYHGTDKDFNEFDPATIGSSAGGYGGFFFTVNENHSTQYPPGGKHKRSIPAYLSIQNPKIITNKQWYSGNLLDPSEYQEDGYDGYLIKKLEQADGSPSDTWIAFDPTQIKSATGNNGNFDPNNPDINK